MIDLKIILEAMEKIETNERLDIEKIQEETKKSYKKFCSNKKNRFCERPNSITEKLKLREKKRKKIIEIERLETKNR